MRARPAPARRPAFTLIELLVVIGIILVLAAITVGYFVLDHDHAATNGGTDRLSGWLLNAKQRAKRDGRATGVRLNLDPATGFVSELVYVQQPDDYAVGLLNPVANSNMVTFGPATAGGPAPDFQGGAAYPGEIDESTVQAGDYLEVFGGGGVHQITQVVDAQTLLLASNVTLAATTHYRIIRQPRRLPSEDALDLSSNVVIDMSANPATGLPWSLNVPQRQLIDFPPSWGGTRRVLPAAEILFGTGGNLVGQGTGGDKVVLWLRDPGKPTALVGSPLLVSVQVRTGFIAVNPVAPAPNYYQYTQDARSSGL
jgi:prepilin-type N-terminal cleavage/methylation domain-containing protein